MVAPVERVGVGVTSERAAVRQWRGFACLFIQDVGATRLRFREFALLPKRVTLKWLPRKGGSDSSPSYWPHLRNTQRNAFNRTLYMVLSSPLPAERESRRRVPPLLRRVPH